jgi:UDP-N-acetylmuramoyl-L-alanyl-D-glutamate--2,6-diaminopimelate ligase
VKGAVFVCILGTTGDGHQFIDDAAAEHAAAIIIDKSCARTEFPKSLTVIRVMDTRAALAKMAAAWYGNPERHMAIIGITGTKGKTTTAYMIWNILRTAGYRTGLIGTNEVWDGKNRCPSGNTTPDTLLLHSYLAKMRQNGCRFVVMEVSSQALMLKRTDGILFDTAVFTNLGLDHIGTAEHQNFEEYRACKAKLFGQCRYAVLNANDPNWKKMLTDSDCEFATFGNVETADYIATDVKPDRSKCDGSKHNGSNHNGDNTYLGMQYRLTGRREAPVHLILPGTANVWNSLAATGVADHYNIPMRDICRGLERTRVKGRGEIIDTGDNCTVMIDYAHNAMSLRQMLQTLRIYQPKRLICVFGCGGGRSDTRRAEMGIAAGEEADLTILTSDNPRDEKPEEILKAIEKGICRTGGKYIMIEDRREAIRYALEHRKDGDIILIAGKGHENYQEIRGVRYPMDDRETVEGVLHVCRHHH